MGQAKRRGTQAERIALAEAWDEAHREQWERERPQREAEQAWQRRTNPRAAESRGFNRGRASLIAMAMGTLLAHRER